MNSIEVFGSEAKWVTIHNNGGVRLVCKDFSTKNPQKITLTACGLGYFDAYINGKRVGNDYLKPLFSDYSERYFGNMGYPLPDKTSHRIYVDRYDVTALVENGDNTIAFLLAPGWYAQQNRHSEGDAKFSNTLLLCFSLEIDGKIAVFSDSSLKFASSHILSWNLYKGVCSDFSKYDKSAYLPHFDRSSWQNVELAKEPSSPLYFSDCPLDTVTEVITPRIVAKFGKHALYDAGKNISGWATFKGRGKIVVSYAEELKCGFLLNYEYSGGSNQKQRDVFLNTNAESDVKPAFRWNGFRYFRIDGEASDVKVEVLHIPFEESATFHSDNDVLNKLFEAYKLTQLNNMHGGVPSDCPHRERLGYTGDGQLTAETAMLCFNSEAFYRKWMEDICDSQDIKTGHVQHTAPFMGGGGGPCGWGGAIVIVPYKYYLMTGDVSFIKHIIPHMERWFDFIQKNTFGTGKEYGLIVREMPKGWCLGDWCTLDKIAIPEPFVNTYYFIKCLEYFKEFCVALDTEFTYQELVSICKNAILENYRGKDGLFCNSVQGADFFACDIGLFEWNNLYPQLQNLRKSPHFDTGICGTDVLLKVLVEHGETDLVARLLSSQNLGSFGYMFANGATTLWEYWTNKKSHDHPMFGSAVKYLFTGLAGITYDAGFKNIVVNPRNFPHILGKLNVSLDKNATYISVDYKRKDDKLFCTVTSTGQANVFVVIDGKKLPINDVDGAKTAVFQIDI